MHICCLQKNSVQERRQFVRGVDLFRPLRQMIQSLRLDHRRPEGEKLQEGTKEKRKRETTIRSEFQPSATPVKRNHVENQTHYNANKPLRFLPAE